MTVYDCSKDVFDPSRPMDFDTQDAVLKADPFVVGIISHNVPDEMTRDGVFYSEPVTDVEENVIWGAGIIIECEDTGAGKFSSTILSPAAQFFRTNDTPYNEIEVDVYLSDGNLCKGEVFACDFHYNLAAIRIQSDFPLQIAKPKALDDTLSIDPIEQHRLFSEKSFQLRRHSNLFKVLPGTKIIYLKRLFYSFPSRLQVEHVVFRDHSLLSTCDCKELYWLEADEDGVDNGGQIINKSGEVIGIVFSSFAFLPSNIVLKWWNHYKVCREFRRPQHGMVIVNLYTASLDFLEQFMKRFPNITSGVVVTKVEKNSAAYHSRIQCKDVIIKCDGLIVRSKLEFFEKIWDKAGRTVQLTVLRVSNGKEFNLSLTIGDSTPDDKYYRWQLPLVVRKKRRLS